MDKLTKKVKKKLAGESTKVIVVHGKRISDRFRAARKNKSTLEIYEELLIKNHGHYHNSDWHASLLEFDDEDEALTFEEGYIEAVEWIQYIFQGIDPSDYDSPDELLTHIVTEILPYYTEVI